MDYIDPLVRNLNRTLRITFTHIDTLQHFIITQLLLLSYRDQIENVVDRYKEMYVFSSFVFVVVVVAAGSSPLN